MLSLFLLSLVAHDLYLMPKTFRPAKGEKVTVAFHSGDDFPRSANAVDPSRITAPALENLRVDGNYTLGEALDEPLIGAQTAPRFLELPAGKFHEYLAHEGLDWVVAWREQHGEAGLPGRELYSKYAKTLLAEGDFRKRLGHALEIVPAANPYNCKVGSRLRVKVWKREKPAAGITLEAAKLGPGGQAEVWTLGKTDHQGELEFLLKAPGIWKLHGVAIERVERPTPEKAQWESFWTSLSFEIR
ncbi:MAG: DUF4198 domain-containing protein [Bryobacter sp.]